jgi:hypothetical protein
VPATIRSLTTVTNTSSSATVVVTTPSDATAAQVGDVLLAFHYNDFYALSAMSAPTGGPGGWQQITAGTADAGASSGHIKPWWAVVTSAGAQVVTFTETGTHDEEKAGVVVVLAGADGTAPIDAAANAQNNVGVTTWTVGPCSPTSSDALLIVLWGAGGGASTDSFSALSGSMTEHSQFRDAAADGIIAYQQLSASGSTGTRAVNPATATAFVASMVAIKAGAPPAPPDALRVPIQLIRVP